MSLDFLDVCSLLWLDPRMIGDILLFPFPCGWSPSRRTSSQSPGDTGSYRFNAQSFYMCVCLCLDLFNKSSARTSTIASEGAVSTRVCILISLCFCSTAVSGPCGNGCRVRSNAMEWETRCAHRPLRRPSRPRHGSSFPEGGHRFVEC